ncbi:pantetheine-phosphate adenylyltransferase [Alkaliphilus sp. MSJ-5]|uniref:Phosphopantetheine adenylyltransferase n=1 Tax=Alkaliphilus flagellatus TaxID=2841507 RepID=A0ABS6G4F2_9FIRM|nr:pantetheine-phosphate adenylyltransferase [Alkaliphilus flagellatus]MBU5677375.1 pantetheine-phosphate adenylyltransferase [Alkaliphilus flagellatus]
MRVAIYPGSFDPITNGHLDIIERASKMCDKLIVSVIYNPNKNPLFTLEERKKLVEESVKNYPNVSVDCFSGLLIEYAKENEATAIIKGLRAISDFEYELQMALMNQKLCPSIETVFLMTSSEYSFLSSSLIKEVARFGGCIKGLVPEVVYKAVMNRF